MAPKKALEPAPVAVVAAAPPVDPIVQAEQLKLEKWNERVAVLQKKREEAVRSVQQAEKQQEELQLKLLKLQQQAQELAHRKVPSAAELAAASAPPPVAPAPAPVAPAPKPSAKNSPRTKGAAAVPEPAPPPPPVVEAVVPSSHDIEIENKRRAKIAHALLNLFKKRRQNNVSPRALENDAGSNDSPSRPQQPNTAIVSSPSEQFSKPNDVPHDLWAAMLVLREERIVTEESLAAIKPVIDKWRQHSATLQHMEGVAMYAAAGSERELRHATIRAEERRQAAIEAAAAATAPQQHVSPPPPSAKRK